MEEQLMFQDRAAFRQWLAENHVCAKGFWMVLGKGERVKTLRPDEALEEALCYGWIDSIIKKVDEDKYVKYFAPRRKDSPWSALNRTIVAKLTKEGRMAAPGLAAVAEAKRNGQWDKRDRLVVTDDHVAVLVKALQGCEPALTNFRAMSPSVQRRFTGYYLDAKKEDARANHLRKIIGALNENIKNPMF